MPLSPALAGLIGQFFAPLAQLIDSLHTSAEEKGQLRVAMVGAQVEFAGKVLDYELRLVEAQTKVLTAEAQGGSWLQRSWRPLTMLVFLALVVCDAFGWLTFRIAPEAWTPLQIGLGGYVVGRSAEKVLPTLADAIARGPSRD